VELCIIRFMNARLLAITTILLLVISGCGYNPEQKVASPDDAYKGCPGCDLSMAGLVFADLNGANLIGANLYGADLRSADLNGADLSGANLREANLVTANLWNANLNGADLRGDNLDGANLNRAIGADFSDAKNVPAKYLKD